MKSPTFLIGLALISIPWCANAASTIVGLDPLLDNGGADGWSGISVIETPITDAGDGNTVGTVVAFNFHTDDARSGTLAASEHRVTPLLIEFDGLDYRVIGVGTERTPDSVGEFNFDFGLVEGTDQVDTSSPNSFHIAVLQQRDNVDNVTAGAIPFAAAGGAGMFQMDIAGPSHVPMVDDVITAGFSSAAGGRDYAFNFEVDFTPEEDADGDEMADAWEDANGLDSSDPDDATEDPDMDGLENLEEFLLRTDPNDDDTDGDDLLDGVETNTRVYVDATDTGSNPLVADTDGDGVDDGEESISGLDPNDPDSDDDGLLDGVEDNTGTYVDANSTGTDPLDPDSDDDLIPDGREAAEGTNPNDPLDGADPNIAGRGEIIDRDLVDGWTNLLYIDETRVFALPGGPAVALEFNFFASNDTGRVTPFVAEIVAPNEFIVRAIGTTRVGGVDWVGTGPQTFPFSDDGEPPVQDGWAAGFITSDADGMNGGSPVPYNVGAGIEGWATGAASAVELPPMLVLDEPPVTGASGTSVDGFGLRDYSFQIVSGFAGPPLAILDFAIDGKGMVSLTWRSKPNTNYGIYYGFDLVDYENDVEDSFPSQGEMTTHTFPHPAPGEPLIFFRVQETD